MSNINVQKLVSCCPLTADMIQLLARADLLHDGLSYGLMIQFPSPKVFNFNDYTTLDAVFMFGCYWSVKRLNGRVGFGKFFYRLKHGSQTMHILASNKAELKRYEALSSDIGLFVNTLDFSEEGNGIVQKALKTAIRTYVGQNQRLIKTDGDNVYCMSYGELVRIYISIIVQTTKRPLGLQVDINSTY